MNNHSWREKHDNALPTCYKEQTLITACGEQDKLLNNSIFSMVSNESRNETSPTAVMCTAASSEQLRSVRQERKSQRGEGQHASSKMCSSPLSVQ